MKRISLILCILWMGFIFYNSSQSGVESQSTSVVILGEIKKYKQNIENIMNRTLGNIEKKNEENNILQDENIDNNGLSDNENNNDKNMDENYNEIVNSEDLSNNGINENIKNFIISFKSNIKIFIVKNFKNFNVFIRKSAHAFEFLVLAVLVALVIFTRNIKGKKAFIYTLAIVLLYAVADEIHQIFVPGRTAQINDVLIDFSGGVIGVILFYCCYYGKRLIFGQRARINYRMPRE